MNTYKSEYSSIPAFETGSDVNVDSSPNYYDEGDVINGQYLIEHIFTKGAIGCVYKCRDISVDRIVVLKGIRADPFIEIRKQDQLVKEIQNQTQLPQCTNLVNISNIFYDNKIQSMFFVMPFIHKNPDLDYGLELDGWIKKGYRFTELDMVYTGIAICNAMKECQNQNGSLPIHGDIKPENIFLEYVGERFQDMPFLSCNIRLADCGAIGYTPGKYFPEEYRISGHAPDHASDVYALIMVLHEMEKHTAADYRKEESIIGALYELMIKEEQWKIYNLAEVFDDFLCPGIQKRFRIESEQLLYKEVHTRPLDIFYRIVKIHSELHMVHKKDTLLDEIDSLWNEAKSHQYTLNGIPLTCYIDRHYFVCANLCANYSLEKKVLDRYEKQLLMLPAEQQKIFGYCYSSDIKDDFRIMRALILKELGMYQDAISLFHEVKLNFCNYYKWLEIYIELSEAVAIEGDNRECLYIEKNLRDYIRISDNTRTEYIIYDLKFYLGMVTGALGKTAESVSLFEEYYNRYPYDLDALYYYGYALMNDGQISKARYPLHMLYYRCQRIRERNNDMDGLQFYPAQTLALYSYMSAYMVGDFSAALREVDEFDRQFAHYNGHMNSGSDTIRESIYSSYSIYQELQELKKKRLPHEYIIQKYWALYKYWKDTLSHPYGYMAFLAMRGKLQALMDLHSLYCMLMLSAGKYDEVISSCQDMISLKKGSSVLYKYLAHAYVGKKDFAVATHYYVEAAKMLKYDYPYLFSDAMESKKASEERALMRMEMRQLGLDDTLI